MAVVRRDTISHALWYVVVQGPKIPPMLAQGLGSTGKINDITAGIALGLMVSKDVCLCMCACVCCV